MISDSINQTLPITPTHSLTNLTLSVNENDKANETNNFQNPNHYMNQSEVVSVFCNFFIFFYFESLLFNNLSH